MSQQKARGRLTINVHTAAMASLLVVLVTSSQIIASGAQVVHAASYNCYNHCFSGQYWPGAIYGAYTNLSTAQLSCTSSACWGNNQQTGFLEYALWLYDTTGHNGACADNASGQSDICWIEDGYTTLAHNGGVVNEYYFWADNRPGQNCIPPFCSGSYNEHYPGVVPSTDYGVYHGYNVQRQSDHSQWEVAGPGFVNTSTSNPITPNQMYVGAELYGPNSSTTGAYGGYAHFTENRWTNSSGNSQYQGCGNSGAGLVTRNSAPPPYAAYTQSPCNSSSGGDIRVWCCNSGGPGTIAVQGITGVTSQPAKEMGIPAITPDRVANGANPAFSVADVARYSQSHAPIHGTVRGQMTVANVQFMSSSAASVRLRGEQTGLADNRLVAVAEVRGNFTFASPLTHGVAHRAFEVFDGTTGNLIMLSVF